VLYSLALFIGKPYQELILTGILGIDITRCIDKKGQEH
jgi:hypothetical protein